MRCGNIKRGRWKAGVGGSVWVGQRLRKGLGAAGMRTASQTLGCGAVGVMGSSEGTLPVGVLRKDL